MKFAERVNRIKPSPTFAAAAKAAALRAKGMEVISFAQGEPDFDTPDNIKEMAYRAIRDGVTKYTPAAGFPELKDAIIQKFQRDNHLTYDRSQVFTSAGAKLILFNLAQALFETGDEVIVPAPYWVSYTDIVLLMDATPVVVPTTEQHGFKISGEQLKSAITPRTRAIILNSPCNPTGATYSAEELKVLVEVLLPKKILIIADDIYEKFVYDGTIFTSIASLGKEIQDQTVVVNGVSKTYSMTGWRIGYAAGPAQIMAAMDKIQTQNVSNPVSFCQKAAIEALVGPQDSVQKMIAEFDRRRKYIVQRLNAMPGITCSLPKGAFYVFPNVTGLFGKKWGDRKLSNSLDVSDFILEEAKVAVVAGMAFGNDNYIRFSYATSRENIEKGMDQIQEALKKLK
ncbi:MAG TPA: pyridoxal phosphate-dependent aminotransferase [Thermodesulfobacteriota bacterium]|nr:pyridoxal phosphate-dependent aminotransferase [Thermodesulfobacteriota bacterium]